MIAWERTGRGETSSFVDWNVEIHSEGIAAADMTKKDTDSSVPSRLTGKKTVVLC